LLVPFLIKTAIKWNILDKPNQEHKTHFNPTPYLGGLAIVIPIFIITLLGVIYMRNTSVQLQAATILIPSVIISSVGFVDDIKNLTVKTRFFFQIATSTIVSLILIQSGFAVEFTESSIANLFLSIFWIVGITNAFNLIDNIDGGAAGISVITGMGIAILGGISGQFLISIFAICICGASLGFLIWNFDPAKIYLGDGGALFLGFIYSILLLQFQPKVEFKISSAAVPILMAALPILDTCVVVLNRVMNKVSIFQGGRDHISHRLQMQGFSKQSSVFVLWIINGFLLSIAILIDLQQGVLEILLSFTGLISMLMFLIYFIFFKRL
jgi:UDP-GlcNAc:undecaprenyl-phosphate GlcNAc-1-phosphate transferase